MPADGRGDLTWRLEG